MGTSNPICSPQQKNRELKRQHRVGQLYSVFIEMMLASPAQSLFPPVRTGGGWGPRLSALICPEVEGYENDPGAAAGHSGIYRRLLPGPSGTIPAMLHISGEDAYHVCRFIISRPDYFRNLFADYPVNRAVGTCPPMRWRPSPSSWSGNINTKGGRPCSITP